MRGVSFEIITAENVYNAGDRFSSTGACSRHVALVISSGNGVDLMSSSITEVWTLKFMDFPSAETTYFELMELDIQPADLLGRNSVMRDELVILIKFVRSTLCHLKSRFFHYRVETRQGYIGHFRDNYGGLRLTDSPSFLQFRKQEERISTHVVHG